MSLTMTIEILVTFPCLGRGSHQELDSGVEAARLAPGRVPRVARLMALALRLDELVRTGQVSSYSALASMGHVASGSEADGRGVVEVFGRGHRRVQSKRMLQLLPQVRIPKR